jgi:hypothetical protein
MNYQFCLEDLNNISSIFETKIPQTIPILCSLAILYYSFKKWNSRVTVEDNYQHIINQKNNTTQSVIDSVMFFDKNKNNINFEFLIKRFKKYNENYNKLSKNKINDIFIFDNKTDFMNCKHYHYKMFLDCDNGRIYGKLNHELIGGSNIGKFCYTPLEKEQKDNFYHSRFYHIFFAIKLILLRNQIPKITNQIPLLENKMDIQRYILHESFERKTNVKATILYNIMQRLYNCLNIKSLGRDLVCFLPIAFYNTKNINNNIGIMWLTFNETDTIESIKKKMEKNVYQIFGTNFLLSNGFLSTKSSSKNTRKNADAIITILFTEDTNNIQISWTYSSVADYPVYVAVHSRLVENTVYLTQTYTVNTPNFEPGELQKSEENYLLENS